MDLWRTSFCQERARTLFGRLSAESFSSGSVAVPPDYETHHRDGFQHVISWRSWTKWLSAIVSLTVLCASLHAQTSPPAVLAATDRITFPGSVREVATTQPQFASSASATLVRSELTPAEAQATLDFSVALKMHNFAELQERTSKGQTISLDEIASKYYPTAADYKKIADWLTAQGFAVQPSKKYNLSVFASGPVAQIERAFGTKFGRITFAGVEYTSALTAPSVPIAVATPVLGINGLQPHLHPIPHFIKGTSLQGMQKLISNQPPYTVAEIAKAYGANGLNVNGTGQKIGIVIDTFPADSDLTLFWNANAVSQSLNNIEKVQVVSGTLPSPSGEETLDVEWSSGTSPGAKVRVYATTALAFVYLDQAYQAIFNDLPSQPGLRQISLSYGLGETYMAQSQMQTDDQYFAALAGAGVSIFVSSGDGGSSPGTGGHDHTGPVQVESPANDPNVTAVGGTSLYLNTSTGAVSSESAWYDGGGGISTLFSRPAWQTGLGVPAGSTRLIPDVSLVADPNTGGIVYLNGEEWQFGGTSWSSPTWAGFCAMINQARTNLSKPSVGLLGPKIYPLIGTSNFRDITTGSNGPNGVYNARPGYDLCTGVGVPSVGTLIQALALTPTPTPSPTPTPIEKDFNHGGSADLVWQNSISGGRGIWMMKNGAVTSIVNLPTVVTSWNIVGVGDFNGDGNADLVWENTNGAHSIWLMKNGVLTGSIALPTVLGGWHIVGAGDFNGDGYASLVWENTNGAVGIWLMKNGAVTSIVNLPAVSAGWHIAGVGDFNGDGYDDLVWEHTNGSHAIWFLQKGVITGSATLPTVVGGWHIAGAADFNGDGYADLVWQNNNGARCIWFMKNGVATGSASLPTTAVSWQIVDH